MADATTNNTVSTTTEVEINTPITISNADKENGFIINSPGLHIANVKYTDEYYTSYSNLGLDEAGSNPHICTLNPGTIVYIIHPEKGRVFYKVAATQKMFYGESIINIANDKSAYNQDKFSSKSLRNIINTEYREANSNTVFLQAIIPTNVDFLPYNDKTPLNNSMVLYVFSDPQITSTKDFSFESKFNIHSRLEIKSVYNKNNLIKGGSKIVTLDNLYFLVYRGEPAINVSIADDPKLKQDVLVSSGANFSVNIQTETKRQFILNLAKELYISTAFDMDPNITPTNHALKAITRAKDFYKVASTSKIQENNIDVNLI